MVTQVSYCSCPMCDIPKGAPMGLSTFRPPDNSTNQHISSDLLEYNKIDALHTLGVRPIRNQFWQYPLCNVHRLGQPDELHQLLLGLVKDLLHWLLNTWKLEMSRMNLRIDSDQSLDILASSTSLNHSIHWKAAPCKVKRSVEWSKHSQWNARWFFSAPSMTGKLRRKQPPMKWWWQQSGHYVNSLYL